jgi:DNA-binding response OmpR family regulator
MPAEQLVLDHGGRWHPGLMPVIRRQRAQPEGGGRQRPVILMIEDDPDISTMYRLQLERDGYVVQESADAMVALELMRTLRPALVLLDLRLPGIDGFEVLRRIRADGGATPPVVVVSNYGDPDMVRRAGELGAADYLVKSRVLPEELSRRVRERVSRPPLQ